MFQHEAHAAYQVSSQVNEVDKSTKLTRFVHTVGGTDSSHR